MAFNKNNNLKPFDQKVWLSSPTMHGDEMKYITEAYETNWVSTVGENINQAEKEIAKIVGCRYAVGLSAGTASLHLALKLAGEHFYGKLKANEGAVQEYKVFCSDMTFDATINPVAYENGAAVGGYLFAIIYIKIPCNALKTIHNAQNLTPAVRDYP